MLTEKDYCDYDTCIALKELGFNEKCHGYYEPQKRCFNTTSIKYSWCNSEIDDIGVIICPTLYEAQKWLREEKKLHITIFSQSQESWQYRITKPHQKLEDGLHGEDFSSFEEALLEGLRTSIKILQDEQKENN